MLYIFLNQHIIKNKKKNNEEKVTQSATIILIRLAAFESKSKSISKLQIDGQLFSCFSCQTISDTTIIYTKSKLILQ